MRSVARIFSGARTSVAASAARSFSTSGPSKCATKAPRILVTGAGGQVGVDLVAELRSRYGAANVVASDVRRPADHASSGPFEYIDVCDKTAVVKACVDHDVDWVVHLASMLSAVGEKNPQAAMHLNTRGIENVLEAARMHNLRVFAPSTIAVFGSSTPRDQTPDTTVMRPGTMYGLTKVYLELLGEYYKAKFGVDFRSVRYPGIISNSALPGGGTTDYAVDIYHQALLAGRYDCFLRADTEMPMMYAPDSTKAAMDLLAAPVECLTQCTYNVTSFSFTPAQIFQSIKARIPSFEITYEPDFRQRIADSWPASLDDSIARRDWGWDPSFSVDAMTDDMLRALRVKYGVAPGQEGKPVQQQQATL
jgi:threonine 3-dehydrogenase